MEHVQGSQRFKCPNRIASLKLWLFASFNCSVQFKLSYSIFLKNFVSLIINCHPQQITSSNLPRLYTMLIDKNFQLAERVVPNRNGVELVCIDSTIKLTYTG